jgi:hypothetical protein
MRRVKLSLGLGAVLALAMATSAQAVSTQSTWTSSSTASPANGTKKAPGAFSGTWNLSATNNINPTYRAAVPSRWAWGWEGVTVRQTGLPICTVQQVNDAKSVAGCPAGSHLGISNPDQFKAEFGPIGLAEGPNTECFGKTFDLYNGSPGELTMVIDGDPAKCATLGFLGAYPLVLSTAGGSTTMTWNLPENIQQPFPGAEGGLPLANMQFNVAKASGKSAVAAKKGKKKKKKKKKKAKHYLLESYGCSGTRDFTMAVDDPYGTHTIKSSAGNCKKPKKAKKKKKKGKKKK